MPRAFQDGFDLYPALDTTPGYGIRSNWIYEGSGNAVTFEAGRFGGQAVVMSSGNNFSLTHLFPSTDSVVIGFAFNRSFDGLITARTFLSLMSSLLVDQVVFWLDGIGRLYVGASEAIPWGSTPGQVIRDNTWEFIEIMVYQHDTLGIVRVKVNGAQVLNLENIDTKVGADLNAVKITHDQVNSRFDDVYCDYDSLVWVGEGRISEFYVNADTVDKDFTPSVGTDNFATLDEVIANITDYNSSSTPGAIDLFTHQAMTFDPVNIFSVQISMLAAKDEAGTRVMRSKLVTGATTQDGPDRFLAQSFAFLRDIYETNPDTALPWTRITFNNAKVGYELVS